jgi:hypothetical protein
MEPKIDHGQKLLMALDETFTRISSERHERPIHGPDFEDSGWIIFERERMHEEVNRLRAQSGKGPVSLDKIKMAERSAMGHVDYQHKFVLGCRDAVWED